MPRVPGKDVHHKDGNPRNNSRSNLTMVSRGSNRSVSPGRPKGKREWDTQSAKRAKTKHEVRPEMMLVKRLLPSISPAELFQNYAKTIKFRLRKKRKRKPEAKEERKRGGNSLYIYI